MQDRARWIRFQVEIERTTYLLYSRPFFSHRRVYESLFAGIVALIDEISTKRIHMEEKIRGNFFNLFAHGVIVLTIVFL